MVGRIGAWSADHPRLVVAVWLLAIAGGLLGVAASGHELTSAVTIFDNSETWRGGELIRSHFANPVRVSTQVLCASGPDGPAPLTLGTTDDPGTNIRDIAWCYEHKWGVATGRDPGAAASASPGEEPGTVIESQPADLVRLLLPAGLATETGEPRLDDTPGATLRTLLHQDLIRAEIIAVPLTLLILVLVIGFSPRALTPIIVGGGAIAVAAGITSLLATQWSLSVYAINMIAMLGLATSVDYTLLVLQREHDEHRAGASRRQAIVTAAASAGQTVAISGLTVILALGAMLPMPISVVRDLALSAMIAVAIGVSAILTVLPALLALLGARSGGRVAGDASPQRSLWRRWAVFVARHPAGVTAIVLVLLVALAGQAMRLQTQLTPIGTGSSSAALVSTTSDYWQHQASITLRSVVEIVVDTRDGADAGIDRMIGAIGQDNAFAPVVTMQSSEDGEVTVVRALVVHPSGSAEASAAVDRLRHTIVPTSFQAGSASALVTGPLAQGRDVVRLFETWEPRVAGLVLIASILVLAIVFRSLVLPLIAALVSMLSVLGTLGVLVLVIQEGHGAALLSIPAARPIEIWVPVALFSILLGLSMDYHIFLLRRITERYRQTGDVPGAVIAGVESTGRVIAAGALIMTVVFASFATGRLVLLQQLGLGLAVAVVIDAFVIRLTLVPAVTILLGHRNWWAPSWLARPSASEPKRTPLPRA